MEAESEPSATCPNPFGAFLAKDLPLPQDLTIFANTAPATLADAHRFRLTVLVAAHVASPDLLTPELKPQKDFAALHNTGAILSEIGNGQIGELRRQQIATGEWFFPKSGSPALPKFLS